MTPPIFQCHFQSLYVSGSTSIGVGYAHYSGVYPLFVRCSMDACIVCRHQATCCIFGQNFFTPCNRYSIDEVSQVYVLILIHVRSEYVIEDLSFLTENVVNDDPDESDICSTQATNRTFDQRNTFIVFHTYCII
jgi:hypothetical protein